MTIDREVKIERGVPVPATCRWLRYPWPEMGIGDSIVVANKKPCNAAYAWGRSHDCKFISRRQSDGSYRIWRVE